jgi:hypothetical protein
VKCHRLEECDWQRLNTPRGEPGVVEAELVKVSLDRMQAEFPRRIIADSVVPYCVSCRPPIKPPHGSTVIRDLLLPMPESAVYVKGQDSHEPPFQARSLHCLAGTSTARALSRKFHLLTLGIRVSALRK